MKRWAALLRAVNLGGNSSLPMARLRGFLEDLGFADVRTLLASGHAVFSGTIRDEAAAEAMLDREALSRLGLKTDFLLRDADDIAAVIRANPFPDVARDRPSQLLVVFGRNGMPADLPDRVAAVYDGPERLVVVGRELFIDFPEGQGRSSLTPALARLKLGGVGTGRNWNTVLKIDKALPA